MKFIRSLTKSTRVLLITLIVLVVAGIAAYFVYNAKFKAAGYYGPSSFTLAVDYKDDVLDPFQVTSDGLNQNVPAKANIQANASGTYRLNVSYSWGEDYTGKGMGCSITGPKGENLFPLSDDGIVQSDYKDYILTAAPDSSNTFNMTCSTQINGYFQTYSVSMTLKIIPSTGVLNLYYNGSTASSVTADANSAFGAKFDGQNLKPGSCSLSYASKPNNYNINPAYSGQVYILYAGQEKGNLTANCTDLSGKALTKSISISINPPKPATLTFDGVAGKTELYVDRSALIDHGLTFSTGSNTNCSLTGTRFKAGTDIFNPNSGTTYPPVTLKTGITGTDNYQFYSEWFKDVDGSDFNLICNGSSVAKVILGISSTMESSL